MQGVALYWRASYLTTSTTAATRFDGVREEVVVVLISVQFSSKQTTRNKVSN
jgi:hypothetical protein